MDRGGFAQSPSSESRTGWRRRDQFGRGPGPQQDAGRL